MHARSFERVLDQLTRNERDPRSSKGPFLVPRFVLEAGAGTDLVDVGNPYSFYRNLLCGIAEAAAGRERKIRCRRTADEGSATTTLCI